MLKDTINAQVQLVERCGKFKVDVPPVIRDEKIISQVESFTASRFDEVFRITGKLEREHKSRELLEKTIQQFPDASEEDINKITNAFYDAEKKIMRNIVLKERKRADGRGPKDIRQITCDLGLLPRVHGSSLFTRGETQALVAVTLGTSRDEQIMDELFGDYKRTKRDLAWISKCPASGFDFPSALVCFIQDKRP